MALRTGGGAALKFSQLQGGLQTITNATWWTTLPSITVPPIELTEEYSPNKYPKYDTYDAINCDRSRKIPKDYYGEIGVPISFLYIMNKEQFEIRGLMNNGSMGYPLINGKMKFARLLIKKK